MTPILRPTQDCLFVRPDLEKHALFELLRNKQTGTGVVLHAGPRSRNVKIGDRILFGDSIGQDVQWDGETLLVMREEHILGVFDE